MDYALHVDNFADGLQYLETASRLARYALRIIAEFAKVVVHEAGHVYLGGGHCEFGHNCCFEIASSAWLCRVRGTLGLLHEPYEPESAHSGWRDYDARDGYRSNLCASCSKDSGRLRYYPYACDTVVEGALGMSAWYDADSCWSEDANESPCPGTNFVEEDMFDRLDQDPDWMKEEDYT